MRPHCEPAQYPLAKARAEQDLWKPHRPYSHVSGNNSRILYWTLLFNFFVVALYQRKDPYRLLYFFLASLVLYVSVDNVLCEPPQSDQGPSVDPRQDPGLLSTVTVCPASIHSSVTYAAKRTHGCKALSPLTSAFP